MVDHVGQQLGNYHLQRLLGRGGFADVYLGEHTYLHKPAALKLLHLHLDEHSADQFLREAQTLARLDHPHIVRVLDFAVQNGQPYLVMDYATGGTLRTKHPTGTRLSLEQILVYVTQVASALQYAHDHHLIHHDIKPENMLLDAHKQVLLADFGLALLTPTHSASTQARYPTMEGTAPYLAPEQVQGQPQPASDQYALAVVVYEWLSGQRPFNGTPIEVALQHVSAVPPPLHEHLPDLSPKVEEVVIRALAKAPKQRFPSVQDFATALQHAAHPAGDAYLTSAVRTTSAAAPDERTAPGPFWKVPASLTSLIGREQDVAAVCAMLSRPDVRLLTLLGVGGIGKTRLSIQVANQLREHFNDGICFVGLAPISNPSLVISSIAHELGLQEAGAQPLVETVKTWLRDKQFLLLLDNFEQIVSAAPLLEDLLTACPRLVILVTSREVLRLSAEHLFPVPPLSLPDLAQLPDHEQLSQYAAVSLFLHRAQALKPDFMLTPANARAIAEICMRIDGLPLAIELAAARIRLLPPQALLARLSQRLQALTSGSRTLPERQQTLRNTIQWSYNLLNEQEQRLFRRLSVFVGGCTLEAVEAVCAALDGADAVAPVLDDVDSLIDKSLVQQTEQEGEEPRLVMLETVREYGQECLRESREKESCHRTHAQYYLTLAEVAELHLHEAQQLIWLKRLNREQENFRAALQWFIKHKESEHALRLSGALSWYWYMRGSWGESLSWLLTALQLSNTGDHTVARARVLGWAGLLTLYQGNSTTEAHTLLEESIALHKVLEDTQGLAFAIMGLGEVYQVQEDYLTAHSLMEESVDLCRQVGDKWMLAVTLGDLAWVIWLQGNALSARTLLEEAWALVQEVGDTWSETRVNTLLADWARAQGDYFQAATHYQKALSVAQQTGDMQLIAVSLAGLGDMARRQDDNAKALKLYSQGLTIARAFGLQLSTCCRLLCGLGDVARDEGDGTRATALYREGLSLAMKDDSNKLGVGYCLLGLARIARRSRQFWRAALLLSATEAHLNIDRDLDPFDRAEYERDLVDIRAYLGEEAFTTAWAQGRTMTPEQALAAQEPMMMPPTAPAEPSSVPHAVKAPTYPAGLTAREVEVLRLVAQGLSDAQVAEQLVISPRTVNGHLRSIYNKINVNSRSAATRYAMEHALIR